MRLFFVSLLGLAILLLTSTLPSFAQTTNPNKSQIEKAEPASIASQQLHKNYTNSQHRYRLTVEGNNLDDNPTTKKRLSYVWSTNCGRFYEGGKGPNSKYLGKQTVVWGYEYPKEDCTEALIQVATTHLSNEKRIGQVSVSQKIFYPEITPKIERVFLDEVKPQSCPLDKRIKIFIGDIWSRLLNFGGKKLHDSTTFETPGGGCVRG